MTNFRFSKETLTPKIIKECEELIKDHNEEILYDVKSPLIDFGFLNKVQRDGGLKCFLIRNDEKIIGYTTFYIAKNPHQKGEYYAISDAIYIKPSARIGDTWKKFYSFIEKELVSENVNKISIVTNKNKDLSNLLIRFHKFEREEIILTKFLKEHG